jgi:predicted DNA-binding protein
MKEKHPITVALDKEVWEALAKQAKTDGRTVAWLARNIIEKSVKKEKGA